MNGALKQPWTVFVFVTMLLIMIYVAYGKFGLGITMWPEVEPNQGSVDIRALGDLSTQEKDQLVRLVEERVYDVSGVDNIYVRSGKANRGAAPDQIGSIRLNFADWRTRRPAILCTSKITCDRAPTSNAMRVPGLNGLGRFGRRREIARRGTSSAFGSTSGDSSVTAVRRLNASR